MTISQSIRLSSLKLLTSLTFSSPTNESLVTMSSESPVFSRLITRKTVRSSSANVQFGIEPKGLFFSRMCVAFGIMSETGIAVRLFEL